MAALLLLVYRLERFYGFEKYALELIILIKLCNRMTLTMLVFVRVFAFIFTCIRVAA